MPWALVRHSWQGGGCPRRVRRSALVHYEQTVREEDASGECVPVYQCTDKL